MAETFTFLREFRSLELATRVRILGCRIPASGSWELFREFSGVFEEFRSLDSCIWAPGARCELRDLSTGYPQIFLY